MKMLSNQLAMLFFVFFVNSVYAIMINKNAALIDTVCRKTDNYNLCVSSLRSDPRSASADTKGLGRIMYEISLAKGKDNLAQVQKLLKGARDPDLKRLLNECLEAYNLAVGDMQDGIRNIDSNAFSDAADKVERATDDVQTCEDSFGEIRRRSPLTYRNNLFVSEAGVGGYIIALLIKKP